MSVNNLGGSANTATLAQISEASLDIAHWAKSSDMKGGESSLYQALANDGIVSPQQNGPMTAYLQALKSLRDKNTSPDTDGQAKASQDAAEAGKQAGFNTDMVSKATDAASNGPSENTAAAASAGSQPLEQPATAAPATGDDAPLQDTTAGQNALIHFMSPEHEAPATGHQSLSPKKCAEFADKYAEDHRKVKADVDAGINNPDNVKALNEDNEKYNNLNSGPATRVALAVPPK